MRLVRAYPIRPQHSALVSLFRLYAAIANSVQDVCGECWCLMGKLAGLSLTGRWSTGACRATECGVWSVGGGGCGGIARRVVWRRLGVRSLRTAPLRRSMRATPTAAERGQVLERGATGPRKKFWRVRPQGEPPRSRRARSSCEPIRRLEAVEREWKRAPSVSARNHGPQSRIRGYRVSSRQAVKIGDHLFNKVRRPAGRGVDQRR